MKKLFLLLLIVSSGMAVIASQKDETRHEIAVGWGIVPNSALLDGLFELTNVAVSGGSVSYENESYAGPLSVEYFYHLSKTVGVGGIGAYTFNEQDVVLHRTKIGVAKTHYFTIMPAAKVDWLRKSHWGLYSKVGAGISCRTEKIDWKDESDDKKTDNVLFNFQASVIGMEVGNAHVRGFAELGIGEQGLGVLGVRCRF